MGKDIRFDRLKKLAHHLKTGHLGHAEFTFHIYNSGNSNTCGTAGCAIGECPIVFPREWHFAADGNPALKTDPNQKPYSSGREFFGLNTAQFDHLFVPFMQLPDRFGGGPLGSNATKDQVSENILTFCEVMLTKTTNAA